MPHTCHSGQPQLKWRQLTRWTSIGATLCAALALVACASINSRPPEEQVRQRATERWQALVAGQFSRAYSYNTSGFRAVVSPDAYRNRFGGAVTWLGAEVIRVDCPEASKCNALVRVDFRPVLSRKDDVKLSSHVDETWLLEDRQWWYFQKI